MSDRHMRRLPGSYVVHQDAQLACYSEADRQLVQLNDARPKILDSLISLARRHTFLYIEVEDQPSGSILGTR